MDVFICLDVSVSLKRAYWREYQVIMTEISQSLVRSARTDTSTTCKKTHNSILIFFYIVQKKNHTENLPKINHLIHAIFNVIFISFEPNTTENQNKSRLCIYL